MRNKVIVGVLSLFIAVGMLVMVVVVGCDEAEELNNYTQPVCEVDCVALHVAGCFVDSGVLEVWPDASLDACKAACDKLATVVLYAVPQTVECRDKLKEMATSIIEALGGIE
jgi:hypothetical protein